MSDLCQLLRRLHGDCGQKKRHRSGTPLHIIGANLSIIRFMFLHRLHCDTAKCPHVTSAAIAVDVQYSTFAVTAIGKGFRELLAHGLILTSPWGIEHDLLAGEATVVEGS